MLAQRNKYVWLGAVLLIILTMITACGSKTGDGQGTNGMQSGQSSRTNNKDTQGESNTSSPSEAAETRIVSTPKGDVEIPAHPQRIVALYYHHILLAFDMKPVGANLTWWGGSPFLKELESNGITDVGGPPSLEAVTKLNPDLIIMNTEDNYDQLSKIAPTVIIPYDAKRNAFDDAKLVADLVGKEGGAEQLVSLFEEKAAAARAKIAGHIDENARAAIIRIEGKGSQFAVFGANYGRGGWPIYEGLKLKMPERIQKELKAQNVEIIQQLAMELLPEYVADADYIFVSNEGEGVDLLQNNKLWNSISAVKNNKVIELGKEYFYFDPISMNAQLDLLADLLLSKK
ncbi:ABC transporter substrate-binding protein [Paenibacillus sp. GCM10012307]|uniref:ABC transporter substrate-binding protein n=1 Tax=Paenibacillus roseus TaxID=2798579 RepID=A0A934J0F2_9BACL|nr:ABC transporter substrate-binding protein [Paenibacillus roseus]MBJ6362552.1 ABC transporter substrate-binding protein [Paenibacillus roseus]